MSKGLLKYCILSIHLKDIVCMQQWICLISCSFRLTQHWCILTHRTFVYHIATFKWSYSYIQVVTATLISCTLFIRAGHWVLAGGNRASFSAWYCQGKLSFFSQLKEVHHMWITSQKQKWYIADYPFFAIPKIIFACSTETLPALRKLSLKKWISKDNKIIQPLYMYMYIYTYIEYFIHIQINFVKHIRFLNKKHMFDKVDLYINKILVLLWSFSKSFAVFVGLSQDLFHYIFFLDKLDV